MILDLLRDVPLTGTNFLYLTGLARRLNSGPLSPKVAILCNTYVNSRLCPESPLPNNARDSRVTRDFMMRRFPT